MIRDVYKHNTPNPESISCIKIDDVSESFVGFIFDGLRR